MLLIVPFTILNMELWSKWKTSITRFLNLSPSTTSGKCLINMKEKWRCVVVSPKFKKISEIDFQNFVKHFFQVRKILSKNPHFPLQTVVHCHPWQIRLYQDRLSLLVYSFKRRYRIHNHRRTRGFRPRNSRLGGQTSPRCGCHIQGLWS